MVIVEHTVVTVALPAVTWVDVLVVDLTPPTAKETGSDPKGGALPMTHTAFVVQPAAAPPSRAEMSRAGEVDLMGAPGREG